MKISLRKIYQKVKWGGAFEGIICYGKDKDPQRFITTHILFIDLYLFNLRFCWRTKG